MGPKRTACQLCVSNDYVDVVRYAVPSKVTASFNLAYSETKFLFGSQFRIHVIGESLFEFPCDSIRFVLCGEQLAFKNFAGKWHGLKHFEDKNVV